MSKLIKYSTFCSALLGLFVATNSYAVSLTESSTVTPVVSVYSLLELTSDSTENTITITPTTDGTFRTTTVNLTATTNNISGYSVLMSTTSDFTALMHTEDYTYYIPTIKQNYTSSTFPTNSWGYSMDGTNYKPITALGRATTIRETTSATSDYTDTFPVTFGAKADMGQAAGTYTSEVVFTLVANYAPTYTYAITYDPNGGYGGPVYQSNSTTEHSHTFIIPSTQPSRSGYTFLGWSTVKTATTASLQAGAEIPLTYESPTTTVYAVWLQNVSLSASNGNTNALGESDSIATIDTTKPTAVINFEVMVTQLPEASEITLLNRTAIERAKAAYEALSEEEKLLIDSDILAKYNAIIAAYYSLINDSSIDPLLTAVAIASVAAIGTGVYVLAKKDNSDDESEESK